MNDQDKRELMLKAAVKFKDGWPHKDKMFLVKNIFDDELFTSNALPAISSYSIVCTRAEYETFVESLFEGAPEGATHYRPEDEAYLAYSSDRWLKWTRYQSWVEYFGGLSAECVNSLIPRPRKSEKTEWNGEGLPPVGVECECKIKNSNEWFECKPIFYSEFCAILEVKNYHSYRDKEFIAKLHHLEFRTFQSKEEREKWIPEVGQECEYQLTLETWSKWHNGFYIGKSKKMSHYVLETKNGCLFQAGATNTKFRPLKTEAEKERERLENLLVIMDTIGKWDVKGDTLEESVCDTFGENAWQDLCEILHLGVKVKMGEVK